MIAEKLKIKNFKSYGNNINEVEFDTEKGQLILLLGKNGHGKTSFIDAFDYILYGKVRGKKKKYVSTASIPNRINKNLYLEYDFKTGDKSVNIIRTSNPSKLVLKIDGEKYDKSGKSNIQNKIEELVGIDIDTFKSFISMSINDFKNFMSLSPDEKRILLDRLFNLEVINKLGKIVKEKKKQNKHNLDLFQREINSYQSSIDDFKESLEKLKKVQEENTAKEIEELKQSILSKKDSFIEYKNRLDKCELKDQQIKNEYKELSESSINLRHQIAECDKKITLYNKGLCPMCGSDLKTDDFQEHKKTLEDKKVKLLETQQTISESLKLNENKATKLKKIQYDSQETFSQIKMYLTDLKSRLEKLKNKENEKEDSSEVNSINEIISSIEKIENRKEDASTSYNQIYQKDKILDELNKMISDDGIKRSIISKIIKPINFFISENLNHLNMHQNVMLDEQFDAYITEFGEDVEVDTLSTGETKKINIAIMLAYLKLIRSKKYINVLFLDEVFSSIDVDGINDVLYLLKSFSQEYKINIFLIHHSMLDQSKFDKVYKIEKNVTSDIIPQVQESESIEQDEEIEVDI